ncbi:MAG TPA: hypothetical protein GX692_06285 [Acholeplasmataceae bacterium]|nr:hypothetical protein [Acholeplasmataceae bacterium]
MAKLDKLKTKNVKGRYIPIFELHPILKEMWDFDKNIGINPDDYSKSSELTVYWKCDKGHSYPMTIRRRIDTLEKGCPKCNIEQRCKEVKFDDRLSTRFPGIAKEFDIIKNNDITADQIHFGSQKVYWWICPKGHSYEAKVSYRTLRGHGCPYCSGYKVTKEESFGSKFPKLLEEWDYSKNEKSPFTISSGSEYKAWWKCPNGHSYQRRIHAKLKSRECPICKGIIANPDNCLATTNPDLLKEWDYDRNQPLNPNNLLRGSHKKVWWICPNGHSYKTTIYTRAIFGTGCPICDAEKRTSFPEQAIGFYLEKFTDVLYRHKIGKTEIDVFLPKLAIGIEYDGSFYHKGSENEKRELRKNNFLKTNGILLIRVKEHKDKRITLNCKKTDYGYAINTPYSQAYLFVKELMDCIATVIETEKGYNYSFDVNIERDRGTILERYNTNFKANSVAIKKPIGIKKWDYSKNGNVDPNTIPVSSKKRFFWKCPTCGYEWEGAVENLTDTLTCAKCVHGVKMAKHAKSISKRKGYSLAEQHPGILKEWDYDKNQSIDPKNITPGSNKKAWWKCSNCGYEWESPIKVRVKGHSCPKCAIQRASVAKFKKVINIETGEIFNSIMEAADKYNIGRTSITACLNGRSKTAGGYHWKYVD